MLKKREEKSNITTWVVEVPADGTFFTLVQARNAAEARKLACDSDDWFMFEGIEPSDVEADSKAFPDNGDYQEMADATLADEAEEAEAAGKSEIDDSESDPDDHRTSNKD